MPRGRKPAQEPDVARVNKSRGAWIVRYSQSGKDVRKSFGDDKEAATKYAEKTRWLQRSGEGIVPSTAREAAMTFSEARKLRSGIALGQLCNELKTHIATHPQDYKDQVNPPARLDRIKGDLGDRSAESIEPAEIRAWLNTLTGPKGKKLSDGSWNRYKAQFSAVYKHAIETGRLKANPVRDVKQKRLNNGVIRFLAADEEQRIRAVMQYRIDTAEKEWLDRMIHHVCEFDIALTSGMRKGEQYGLQWPRVDLKGRTAVLVDTKNGDSRIVLLTPKAVEAFETLRSLNLKRKPRSNDRPNQSPEDSCFALADPKKWFAEVLKEAKVKNFRWHDLRHTFCSRLAQAGKPLLTIKELAGHKTLAMTARYAHLDESTRRDALESVFA